MEQEINNQPGRALQALAKKLAEIAAGKIRKIPPYFMILAMSAAVGTAFYFRQEAETLKDRTTVIAQDETKQLLASISKLIVLPEDETPTIATVSDPEALKGQPFFARAKTGDKVLIYAKAKKAILYSPTENRIIEVAPVNLGKTP